MVVEVVAERCEAPLATGGREPGADPGSWSARPVLGSAVRVLAAVTPLVASVFVPWALARRLVESPVVTGPVTTMALLISISAVVYAAAQRLCREMLPLGMLLGLSLGFPGAAPSRLRMGFASMSLRDAQRVALHPDRDRTAAEAAHEVVRLIAVLGRHDRLTRGHVERVGSYADLVAAELDLDAADRGRLRWAAILHDIGKLAVPAAILNKTSSLTDDEWQQVKLHPAAGDALIAPLKEWLGDWGRAVVEHHERMDGAGYPAGLAGDEISLGARIVSVVDAFDVMTSHRSYQPAIRPHTARQQLFECAGTQFDPAVVRAFLAISTRKLAFVMGPVSLLAQLPLFGHIGQWSTVARAAPGFAPLPAVGTAAVTVGLLAMPLLNASANERPVGASDASSQLADDEEIGSRSTRTSDAVATTRDPLAQPDPPPASPVDPIAEAVVEPPPVPVVPTTPSPTVPPIVPTSVPGLSTIELPGLPGLPDLSDPTGPIGPLLDDNDGIVSGLLRGADLHD